MTTVKVDLNKAVKDGLISAKNAKLLEKEYGTSRATSSIFINFLRDIGCVLVAAGLLTLLHTLGDSLATWAYTVLITVYLLLAGLLFHKWQKQGNVPQLASAVGLVIPVAVIALLKPWLAPNAYLMPNTWHIVTFSALAAAAYIAYRHNHWLTNVGLAAFWSLFAASIVSNFNMGGNHLYEFTLMGVAAVTTALTYAWRHYIPKSTAASTTWLHVAAALFWGFATLPSLYESPLIFLSAIIVVLLGGIMQRPIYSIIGALVLIANIIEQVTSYFDGPFAMAITIIVLGMLLLSISYKTWGQKFKFKWLPKWVVRN